MKIVITGLGGQLGHDCFNVLQDAHEVIGTTSKLLDITNAEETIKFIKKTNPDVILNCAAFTDVENSIDYKESAININVFGPRNLSLASNEVGAKLIHISTDFVFDGELSHPCEYGEEDHCCPLNEYGNTKFQGEVAVQSFCDNYAIIRTSWLYGINGNNFVKTILRKILIENKKHFSIVADQYGTPTSTIALANQLKVIIESGIEGIIHASCEGSCTWYDFTKKFINLLELKDIHLEKCSSIDYPSKVIRPKNSTLNNKVLNRLGNNVMPHWEIALEQFINSNRKQLLSL